MSRAPSPAGTMPALDDRRPEVGGGVGRHGDLDAALARVAGAGDDARHAVPVTRATGTARRRPPRGTPSPAARAAVGSLHGEHGPLVRRLARRRSPSRTRSVFDAFGITSNTSPSRRRVPPHDDVVEHRAVGVVEQVGVLRPAGGDLAEVVGQRPLQRGRGRPAPATRTVPRCETSNTTAAVAAGQVLGDRAGRVLERHVPAAERHHPGPELAVDGVERRVLGASRRSPRTVTGAAPARPAASSARAASSWASMSSLTPASGSTLSTPWPWRSTSTSSSPSHSITWLPLITMWARAMSDVDVPAQVGEDLAHRLELDAGVEQGLDHPQLEQVAVASTGAGCRCRWPRPATGG